jgi:hypothetical protein
MPLRAVELVELFTETLHTDHNSNCENYNSIFSKHIFEIGINLTDSVPRMFALVEWHIYAVENWKDF